MVSTNQCYHICSRYASFPMEFVCKFCMANLGKEVAEDMAADAEPKVETGDPAMETDDSPATRQPAEANTANADNATLEADAALNVAAAEALSAAAVKAKVGCWMLVIIWGC